MATSRTFTPLPLPFPELLVMAAISISLRSARLAGVTPLSPAIPDAAPPLPELVALGSASPAGVTPLGAAIPDTLLPLATPPAGLIPLCGGVAAVSVVGVGPKRATPIGVRGTGPTLAGVTPLGVFGTAPPPAGVTPLGVVATAPYTLNPAARSRRLADGVVAMA